MVHMHVVGSLCRWKTQALLLLLLELLDGIIAFDAIFCVPHLYMDDIDSCRVWVLSCQSKFSIPASSNLLTRLLPRALGFWVGAVS